MDGPRGKNDVSQSQNKLLFLSLQLFTPKAVFRFFSILTVMSLGLAVTSVRAQGSDTDEERYNSVTTYGITSNTNSGIIGGFVFRQSKALPNLFKGRRQFRYMSIEVVNVKHPKELQSQTAYTGGRFVYGKQNYLFVVRPQYGREVSLFTRTSDEGIAVNGIVAIGPSLGIIKPYFIQFQSRPGQQVQSVPFDPNTNGLQQESILGAGGFFQGFEKSKLAAGLNAKAAVSFELSAFHNSLTGLEVGFLIEAFTKKIPIMAYADNRNVFTSGYISLFFGNKR